MNNEEAHVAGGVFVGLFFAVGLIAFGFQVRPDLMAPALTWGILIGSAAVGGWAAYAAFKSEAKNFRR